MVSIADIQNAIQALYGQDPASRQAANLWLSEFANSEQAWDCLQLLQPGVAPDVQFFSINLIFSKVQRSWRKLEPNTKQRMQAFLRSKLDEMANDPGAAVLVMQRLCLVLASIAAAEGAGAGVDLVQYACQLARPETSVQAGLTVALELLLGLAESAAAMNGRRQATFVEQSLQPQAARVFHTLGQVLQSVSMTEGLTSATASVLRCCEAWLGQGFKDQQGQSVCSPAALQTHQSELFSSMLGCIAATDSLVLDATAEALETMLEGEEAGADDSLRAMSAIAQALLGARNAVQGESGVARARLVARVAAALANHSPEAVAHDLPEAVQLAELVLNCLSLGERQVAEFAIDYLDCLSTVPLAERQPQLQQPLYSGLLQVLQPHMQYPQDFTTWDEVVEDDEEAFHRFREQSLQEVLEICFGVLKGDYLASLGRQLQAAPNWQQAEAALFGIRCVSTSVLELAEASDNHQAPTHRHQQNIRAFLGGQFGQLCTGQGRLSQTGLLQKPWLVATAARLISDYALWFSTLGGPEVPLEGALKLLLTALQMPQARSAGAKAFRILCIRCPCQLSNPAALSGLITSAHAAMFAGASPTSGNSFSLEDRQGVVEGLARAAALLPAQEAAEAGLNLIAPFLHTARLCTEAESGVPEKAGMLADQLQLVACAIKAMDFGPNNTVQTGSHPVLRLLQESQPVLSQATTQPALQANAAVVSGVCEVYLSSLTCIRDSADSILPMFVNPSVTLFQTHQHPPCLDVLAACVELFGQQATARDSLTHALYAVCSAAEPMFRENQLTAHTDLVTSLFQLADNCILVVPASALASGALPSLCNWAMQAVQMREAEPLRKVINFLTHWISPTSGLLAEQDKKAVTDSMHDWMSHHGQGLVQAFVLALVQTCPRHLLRPLAVPLQALLKDPVLAESIKAVLTPTLCSEQCIALSGEALKLDSCQIFCRLATQSPPMSIHRFSALVSDFGSVARCEGTPDVLLAYDLHPWLAESN